MDYWLWIERAANLFIVIYLGNRFISNIGSAIVSHLTSRFIPIRNASELGANGEPLQPVNIVMGDDSTDRLLQFLMRFIQNIMQPGTQIEGPKADAKSSSKSKRK